MVRLVRNLKTLKWLGQSSESRHLPKYTIMILGAAEITEMPRGGV